MEYNENNKSKKINQNENEIINNPIQFNFVENTTQIHKIEVIFNTPDKMHEFILLCKKARKIIEEKNQMKLLEIRNEY